MLCYVEAINFLSKITFHQENVVQDIDIITYERNITLLERNLYEPNIIIACNKIGLDLLIFLLTVSGSSSGRIKNLKINNQASQNRQQKSQNSQNCLFPPGKCISKFAIFYKLWKIRSKRKSETFSEFFQFPLLSLFYLLNYEGQIVTALWYFENTLFYQIVKKIFLDFPFLMNQKIQFDYAIN